MPNPTTKITESTRSTALKQPFSPSVAKDSEIAGFELIVTTRRAFWCQRLQPHGRDPNGKRWRVVRHELGDARTMTVSWRPVKPRWRPNLAIKEGKDPHKERLASRASAVAQRSTIPTTAGEAAALYAQAIVARGRLSDRTKRATVHYLRKATGLLGGDAVALAAIDTGAILLMVDKVDSSAFERRHVYSALDRFLTWCAKRGLIPAQSLLSASILTTGRRPGRSRDHTPPVATIGQAWGAVENAPAHVRALYSLLLAIPLRREEAQGLLWSEVDLDEKRVTIRAERMKNRQPHTLPLSEPALAILAERMACRTGDDRVFAPPSGALTINWSFWMRRCSRLA